MYDYRGYGVGTDKCAILRFLAVWGGEIDEWKRWRKNKAGGGLEERDGSGSRGGGKSKMRKGTEGVMYSEDVFMAPMVFPKGTTATASSSGKESSSSSSTATLNLPDNVYVCGDELDFIEDDTTTVATSGTAGSSSNEKRKDSSLLDICNDDDDDDMPSVTASSCYGNSTLYGEDDEYYEEDEVSLFTCGASCNEVEHTSSIVTGGLEEDEKTEFSASTRSSYHQQQERQQQYQRSASAPMTTSTSTCTPSPRHLRRRRRSSTLTPKQKRTALLRKYKWSVPSPSEEQCYGDILLAYNYLLQIEEVPAKHVVLYGKSVGSGPTCWLAQRTCQQSSSNNTSGDGVYDGSHGAVVDGMMYDDVRDDGDVDYRDERGGVSSGCGGGGRSIDDDDVPGGVVLHSPFLSVIRVVLDMGFTTVGDLFPNTDRVKDFT